MTEGKFFSRGRSCELLAFKVNTVLWFQNKKKQTFLADITAISVIRTDINQKEDILKDHVLDLGMEFRSYMLHACNLCEDLGFIPTTGLVSA